VSKFKHVDGYFLEMFMHVLLMFFYSMLCHYVSNGYCHYSCNLGKRYRPVISLSFFLWPYLDVCREILKVPALFTFLVGWHASAVSLPPRDAILAQLACPLSDVIFCLYWE